jgi:TatD DNase family protein
MIDTHCHLDLYPNPTQTASEAQNAGVFSILVTNLPSAFDAAHPHVKQFKKIRLALGLHPLVATSHTDAELQRFKALVAQTSFIGEVGLDFSREGVATKTRQVESFRFVLKCLQGPKFVTVHSRQAEAAVLDLVDEEYQRPIVFHWYTGTQKNLFAALRRGHFFSINPAMILSPKGRAIIERIPPDRALTESDGPFVKIGQRNAVPSDVALVEIALAKIWRTDQLSARRIVASNFERLIEPLRTDGATS